jgi:glutamine---fructose-6-phosphate transaminase (isomerizing)
LLLNFAKIHAETVVSSEFQYSLDGIGTSSVLIALSQSGETADVLQAVKTAKRLGCTIVSIGNNSSSSLANCGPEVGVAATKSFTAQLFLIYEIVDRLCNNRLWFDGDRASLVETMGEILTAKIEIERIAEGLKDAQDIYVIGRSIHYPIALEAALKIKELSYVHAEDIVVGELKHGPLALISNKPV